MSPNDDASPIMNVRRDGAKLVAYVEGDIDLNRSTAFQQALLELLDERPTVMVVNLSGVGYMDSSGVASLVKLLARARRSGTSVRLAQLRDRVRSVFEITRLDSVFSIYATDAEALA